MSALDADAFAGVDLSSVSEVPSFWRRLLDPRVKTVFITGCGGGFDFVHSMTVIPILRQHGKQVVIGSNSFGLPHIIEGGQLYWESSTRSQPRCAVYRVDGSCKGPEYYAPEVGLCNCLDALYPDTAPHWVYAYYARSMTVPDMKELYECIVEDHEVDAVLAIDGGSDSLMKGDEKGLGDPVEDATTLSSIALIDKPRVLSKTLVCIGVGCDRFNGVSDSSTLRAIAELTRTGAFLGCAALSPPVVSLYERVIKHQERIASFNSVIANAIVAAGQGAFGSQHVPESLRERVMPGQLYLWPFMAMHFGFDIQGVVDRSLMCPLLEPARTVEEQHMALRIFRQRMQNSLVEEEPLP